MDLLLKRTSFLFEHLFEVGIKTIVKDTSCSKTDSIAILCKYEKFVDKVRDTFQSFVNRVLAECESKIRDDFIGVTKIIDFDLSMMNDSLEYALLPLIRPIEPLLNNL